MMFCPMRGVRCTDECAWWCNEAGACAVTVIAETGGYCCQPHGEYADLFPDDGTDMEDRG